MTKDRTPVSPDEYILCRGIPVPKWFISAKESEFEAKLVPDSNAALQATLDRFLEDYRLQAIAIGKSIHPKGNMISSKNPPGFFFYSEIPIPAGMWLDGLPTFMTNAIQKPIWFFRPRMHQGAGFGKVTKW